MKGNDQVIATLNVLLADELTAINQYIVHSEMCSNWGYGKLHDAIEARAITEMRHAEKLIERLLFLEGRPIVNKLNDLHIGANVVEQFRDDEAAEAAAVTRYNDGVQQASELRDNGTRVMLEGILHDEEEHLDWLETQLDQIQQMGLAQYLVEQVG